MAKIIGNLVGPPNPRPVVDTEIEWASSSKNAISHEAVAAAMSLLNSDIRMEIETVRGDLYMLQNLLDEVFVETEDLGDVEEAEVFITNNTINAYGLVSTSLVCYLGETPSIGFTSALYFTSPDAIPENYTTFPDNIYFKGDSTEDGAFVPTANMRYTIVFDYDGYMVNAYVSEVTTV